MGWWKLIGALLVLSPFVFLWLVLCTVVGIRLGWQSSVRVGLVMLPLLIVIGLLLYGLLALPERVQHFVMGTFYTVISLGALYIPINYLVTIASGGDVWVDSQPEGFIEIQGVKFNALVLLFGGLFALFNTVEQLVDMGEAGSWMGMETLELLLWGSLLMMAVSLAFLRFQIRQRGVVSNTGDLIPWTSIVDYEWVKYQDKVKLEVKRWPWGTRSLTLRVPPELRSILEQYLTHQVVRPSSSA